MGKKKLSKKFEKAFNQYEEDDLKVILEAEFNRNLKNYKSSLEAKEILNQFNIPYFGITKYYNYVLNQLLLLCEKHHVYVNDNIEISLNDVIDRIKENCEIQIKMYERYKDVISTNLYTFPHDNNYINLLDTEELRNLYNNIIEKLKEDDKVLVKKHE